MNFYYTVAFLCILSSFTGSILVSSSYGCTGGSVRLVAGGTNYSGRLEICQSGLWYSVCADNSLCTTTAMVVCRQLGYSTTGVQAYGLALYGQGNGTVGFQNVSCSGTETNITQCNYTTPSTCSHSMDAGIHCNPAAICRDIGGHSSCCDIYHCYIAYPYFCWCDEMCHDHDLGDCCPGIEFTCPYGGQENETVQDGLMIVGSSSCSKVGEVGFDNGGETVGRLVICDTDYRWKTVCSEGFDEREAMVICRSLGLSITNFTIYNMTEFGQGVEDIYPKSLQCHGNESRLVDCPGYDVCCGHHQDVGISCQASCVSGDLRLVGGADHLEGRLEVCHEGRWGTVCDSNWGIVDAQVVCRSMGLPWRGAQAFNGQYTNSHYGQAAPGQVIWLEDIECSGSEDNFWNCSNEDEIGHIGNCQHTDDASLICAYGPCELAGYNTTCCTPTDTNSCQGVDPTGVCHCSLDCEDHNDCCIDVPLICSCNNFDLRLRDGTVPNEGRIEICFNGKWGAICDNKWLSVEAQVVCRQLGYNTIGAQALDRNYFGYSGHIWIYGVWCSGSETRLISCYTYWLYSYSCFNYNVGVRCIVPDCVHGEVRLVNGPNKYEGQLEVCYNGRWGAVCGNYFSQVDVDVACRSIFPSMESGGGLRISYPFFYFGGVSTDYVMALVQCVGTESNIFNCSHSTSDNQIKWCTFYNIYYVALACYPAAAYDGQPMLVPGPSAGRLLVYTGSSWGTVCQYGFGLEDARVVCRELGLPTGSPRVYRNLQFHRGYNSIKYSQVGCVGTETHLKNCTKQTSGFFCSHYLDVGVGCEDSCTSGQIRLVGGANRTEGRVEICRNNTWGTICDSEESWGQEEAHVLCKQLGYPYTAAQASGYGEFGPGPDPFHYSNVDCQGDEPNIGLCLTDSDHGESCTSHYQDVGVVCLGLCLFGSVRLVDGTNPANGRLEICMGGSWGTVCDEQFHNVDAQIVCKQLGLPHEGAEARYGALFGEGSDHIALTSLICTGSEESIISCSFHTGSAVTCSHANDAGVICQDHCQNGAIRLAGGNTPNTGRVEVCYNGDWGTICDKGWTHSGARVACAQLGFEPTYVRTYGGSKYGAGIGRIYFRDIQCIGNESSLIYCPGNTDTTGCDHTDDAGLSCDGGNQPVNVLSSNDTSPVLPLPGIVSDATVSTVNSTSVRLHWRAPDNIQSIITGYQIAINGETFHLLGNQQTLSVNHLKPGYPYMFEIAASNVFGTGDTYRSQEFFTAELAPNVTVNIVIGERIDEYTIFISWEELSLFQARGHITGYVVKWTVYNDTSVNATALAIVPANVTNFTTPQQLLPSKRYTVSVSARTSNGTGPPSSPVFIVNTTSSVHFQLKLSLRTVSSSCQSWMLSNTHEKLWDIKTMIAQELASHCVHCTFSIDHIDDEKFRCDSAESVIFSAQIFTPGSLTNTTVLGYLIDWLTSGNATLVIGGVAFLLDTSCNPDGITGFDDAFCAQTMTAERERNSLSVGIGVGVFLSIVLIIMIALSLVILIHFKIKSKAGAKITETNSIPMDDRELLYNGETAK